ncbi:MAG: 6-bladed beta-propeller [Bacteroidetes bacterium]|jgi:hypothetical protein|nr:6-bladed beta-propeller [Bacteroidota bacterium]
MIYLLIALTICCLENYRFGDQVEISQLGETEFYEITDFKVFNNHIYIADKSLYKLYKFDEDGKRIASTGNEGRGPGEFMRGPKQIIPTENLIYVTGVAEPFYYLYDSDLNFIENNDEIPELVNVDFMDYRNGSFYGAAYPGLNYHIIIYNLENDEVKKIDLEFEIDAGLLNRFRVLDFDNMWVIGWYYKNKFIQYDREFTKIGHFQLPDIKGKADGVYAGRGLSSANASGGSRRAELVNAGAFAPEGSFFEEFVVLDSEHFMIQTGKQTGGSDNVLVVNKHGEIKQKLRLPEEGEILNYSNGVLYLLKSNQMQIVAYEFFK